VSSGNSGDIQFQEAKKKKGRGKGDINEMSFQIRSDTLIKRAHCNMLGAFNYQIAAREEAGFTPAAQADEAAGCFQRDAGRKPRSRPV